MRETATVRLKRKSKKWVQTHRMVVSGRLTLLRQTVKMEVDADVPTLVAESIPSAANAEQEVKEEDTSTVDITLT
jgi:hypothetical protein